MLVQCELLSAGVTNVQRRRRLTVTIGGPVADLSGKTRGTRLARSQRGTQLPRNLLKRRPRHLDESLAARRGELAVLADVTPGLCSAGGMSVAILGACILTEPQENGATPTGGSAEPVASAQWSAVSGQESCVFSGAVCDFEPESAEGNGRVRCCLRNPIRRARKKADN